MHLRRVLICLLAVLLTATACSDSDGGFASPAGQGADHERGERRGTERGALAAEKPKPFTITEKWWSYEDSYGSKTVHWAATVRNPNSRHYGEFSSIRVTARNAAGKVIGTEEGMLDFLPPSGAGAATSQFSVSEEPATVDVTYMKSDWEPTSTTPKQYRPFRPTGMSVARDEYSDDGYTVLGELTNPYAESLDGLHAVALLRDGSGKLVGGGFTYIDGLPADGSAPFEISATGTPNVQPVGADVVVAPSNLSDATWEELARG